MEQHAALHLAKEEGHLLVSLHLLDPGTSFGVLLLASVVARKKIDAGVAMTLLSAGKAP
jgi:hypothetical protein